MNTLLCHAGGSAHCSVAFGDLLALLPRFLRVVFCDARLSVGLPNLRHHDRASFRCCWFLAGCEGKADRQCKSDQFLSPSNCGPTLDAARAKINKHERRGAKGRGYCASPATSPASAGQNQGRVPGCRAGLVTGLCITPNASTQRRPVENGHFHSHQRNTT